jgi:putative component of membrane protein insertase Oxa1/YidC/SpoIIIJ protein YidD
MAMKSIALSAIRFYQRVLSPRKGYCCAYASYTGHASCSALGYRAIRRFGLWHGLSVLNGRLEKCGVAYRRYRPSTLARQAGFLDCDCDVGGCDIAGDVCSNASDCDWKRRRNRGDEQYVVIPPRSNVRN